MEGSLDSSQFTQRGTRTSVPILTAIWPQHLFRYCSKPYVNLLVAQEEKSVGFTAVRPGVGEVVIPQYFPCSICLRADSLLSRSLCDIYCRNFPTYAADVYSKTVCIILQSTAHATSNPSSLELFDRLITAATEMKSLHDTSLSLPEGHPDNCVGVRNGRKVVAITHCRVGKVCLYSPRASHGPLTLAAEAFHLSQQPLGMTCHIFFTSWIQERLPSSSHTATAIMADPSACEQHFSKQ